MLASVVFVTSWGLHNLSPTALPRGLCRGRGGGREGCECEGVREGVRGRVSEGEGEGMRGCEGEGVRGRV